MQSVSPRYHLLIASPLALGLSSISRTFLFLPKLAKRVWTCVTVFRYGVGVQVDGGAAGDTVALLVVVGALGLVESVHRDEHVRCTRERKDHQRARHTNSARTLQYPTTLCHDPPPYSTLCDVL